MNKQMPKMNMRQKMGERLRAARISMGMSQRDVAGDLKKSQQTIAGWESGKQLPDLFDLRNLCTLYSITPNHILLDEGEAPPIASYAAAYAACIAQGRKYCQIIDGERHMLPLKFDPAKKLP